MLIITICCVVWGSLISTKLWNDCHHHPDFSVDVIYFIAFISQWTFFESKNCFAKIIFMWFILFEFLTSNFVCVTVKFVGFVYTLFWKKVDCKHDILHMVAYVIFAVLILNQWNCFVFASLYMWRQASQNNYKRIIFLGYGMCGKWYWL